MVVHTEGCLFAGGHEAADALARMAHAAIAAACALGKDMHPVSCRQPSFCRAHARLVQPRPPLDWQHLPSAKAAPLTTT